MAKRPKVKIPANLWRGLGILGTALCVIIFARQPSWPTPDKLLIFLMFVFMIFGQAKELLKRLLPFVGLMLIYESFRGLAGRLNSHVNFSWMVAADRWLFGVLPTVQLQQWWWHGHVQWYDFAFYVFYMLHFVLPITLAIIVWKLRESQYWRLVTSYVILSFSGFITYALFPAAAPWMAAERGIIPPIERISSHVWYALGIHDFPSLYNKIAPNPVAAVPSLHAAYSILFSLFVWKLFGKKWAIVSLIYPFMIMVGTVYQGEHYAIDAILGVIYALAAYWFTNLIWKSKFIKENKAGLIIKRLQAKLFGNSK